MSKGRCSSVSDSTALYLAKRARFIFGIFAFTILTLSAINEARIGKEAQELTSFIYLNGFSKNKMASCPKPLPPRLVCSGVLFTARYIITAGSCLEDPQLQLHVGMLRPYTMQSIKIKNGYKHSGYTTKKNLIRNDISLLKLIHKIDLSKYVTKASIARETRHFQLGTKCKGVILKANPNKNFLPKVTSLTIVNNSNCNIDGPTEICFKQNSDKGLTLNGTAVWCPRGRRKKKYVVAGILSRIRNGHAIYTNMSHYRDWIDMIRH